MSFWKVNGKIIICFKNKGKFKEKKRINGEKKVRGKIQYFK